jgi:aspartate beta-hydroxylase
MSETSMNETVSTNDNGFEGDLQTARAHMQQGGLLQAELAYQRVLAAAPDHPEALNFLGARSLALGNSAQAVSLLERAAQVDPANPQLLKNLGMAYLAVERLDDARAIFARALDYAPDFFVARLYLAHAHERSGDTHAALVNYFAAVTQAQIKGRWRDDATTAPAIRDLVKYAMSFIDAGRRQLFDKVLAPYREKHGDAAMRRTLDALAIFLEERPPEYADPRQKPTFMYFPGLPTSAYLDQALFAWTQELERNTEIIRNELIEVLKADEGIEPFIKFRSDDDIPKFLGGADGKPVWDAFFFYRHGKRYNENCARCPKTAAILDSLPLVRIPGHAPEICFSVLTPGTHILPHRGVTNTRLVTHLPLIVPDNCALNVGGELHEWQEGRCVSFDDTFEHEAWNRGDSTRVVLIMDCWNPHLTEVERAALNDLIVAIGEFHRECGISEE